MRSVTTPIVLSLGLAALLGACTPPVSEFSAAEAPKSLRVDYLKFRHEAGFAPGATALAPRETAQLTAFLDDAQVEGGGKVYLQAASNDRFAAQRTSAVVQALARRGVGAVMLPDQPSARPDQLTILVERYVVTPPDCPDWSRQGIENHANAMPSNYGCSSLTNLALMVADPRDLVTGRPLGPADADPALKAVQRYRAGRVSPLLPSGDTTPFTAPAAPPPGSAPAPGPGQS